jgi:hypothetical protein
LLLDCHEGRGQILLHLIPYSLQRLRRVRHKVGDPAATPWRDLLHGTARIPQVEGLDVETAQAGNRSGELTQKNLRDDVLPNLPLAGFRREFRYATEVVATGIVAFHVHRDMVPAAGSRRTDF